MPQKLLSGEFMLNILVAEDDVNLNKIVCSALVSAGYDAASCRDGAEAIEKFGERHFDMIISDIMMPAADGFALLSAVMEAGSDVPVIFMTALDDMPSKQRGYRLGIDDYIVKPFDVAELILRVRAVARRAGINRSKKLELGNLVMDEDEHTAYVDGREIALTVREFDILFRLLSFPNVIITSHQGFFTEEALEAIAATTLSNAAAFEKGEINTANQVK